MTKFEQPISRRKIIQFAGATTAFVAAPAIWRRAEAEPCPEKCQQGGDPLPPGVKDRTAPKFDLTGQRPPIAGVRPHRKNCYRLGEAEHPPQGKYLIHNYGHGGAGITMSWGCAVKIKGLVEGVISRDAQAVSKGIAVLGAGVMGLTAATLLREMVPKRKITIYAERTSNTTSHKAGGQWCPASVEHKGKLQEFKEILHDSHARFMALSKPPLSEIYGVSERENFTILRANDDESFRLAPDLTPETCLERLPFKNMNCSGFVYKTMLIEPPIFLAKLKADLKAAGIVIQLRKFKPATETSDPKQTVAGLSENIIVNCTGMGSRKLFGDDDVIPVKGQLVMLRPQTGLDYLFSGFGSTMGHDCHDWVQYVFPRRDAVVVGGTYEWDVDNEKTNKKTLQRIVKHVQSIFEGEVPNCDSAEDFPNHGL
jgi:D-amino-acid oxidase